MTKTFRMPVVAAAAAATLLVGCSSDTTTDTDADAIVVTDAWAKAAAEGMTGAFAQFENVGSGDVTIVSATSTISTTTELHEMAPAAGGGMVMQETENGFTVPAGDTYVLEPGGDHLMLMDLLEPVTPGTDVSFTLVFEDGSSSEFTAQVRDFAGAQEDYAPGHGEEENHGG